MAKNAADLNCDSYWYSYNENNSWLCYDFKDMQIKPTHYSIRSRYNGGSDDRYLKNWIVEVSKDGLTWTTIDERRNNSDLKGANLTRTFTVSPCDYCRFIRVKHQGYSWQSSNYYYFVISSFEIFGDLRE
jgi:E3 ubiquitin-protein ligase HECTD1